MTRWLQDSPGELVRRLRSYMSVDLRPLDQQDTARAEMFAAADMIEREIVGKERIPLHWSSRDRWRDAWDCLLGRAYIVRRREHGRSWQWPTV